MTASRRSATFALSLLATGALATRALAAPAQTPPPRLILLLTIDQGRGDYLERFRPVLRGGLGRLASEGVVFVDAHHAHATTVTAAGHASLSTGRHPSRSGMVGNEWFDRATRRQAYCVEDAAHPALAPAGVRERTAAGRSPKNLLTDGLADWIKREHEGARVVSLAAKDRAAVLMGAQNGDAAYWYDRRNGHWITSSFYDDAYPDWVQDVHAEHPSDVYFGTSWTPLPVDDDDLTRMGIAPGQFEHAIGPGFPYRDRRFYQAIYDSPFIETLLFDFARRAVREESLGQDDVPDVLALGFASVDTVGHTYGPNSREVLDTFLRLDRELGEFLDFIDDVIGLDRVAISLSADHGVAPLPEHAFLHRSPSSRPSDPEATCVQRAGRALEDAFGKADWFLAPRYLDPETVSAEGRTTSELVSFLSREISACASVERVWMRSEIEAAPNEWADPMRTLYRNGYYPERSSDFFVQYQAGRLPQSRGTTHGSPHPYDTHVIAVLRWPGRKPGVVSERIHTVDVPVTLSHLMGIEPPSDVDGVDRSNLIE